MTSFTTLPISNSLLVLFEQWIYDIIWLLYEFWDFHFFILFCITCLKFQDWSYPYNRLGLSSFIVTKKNELGNEFDNFTQENTILFNISFSKKQLSMFMLHWIDTYMCRFFLTNPNIWTLLIAWVGIKQSNLWLHNCSEDCAFPHIFKLYG